MRRAAVLAALAVVAFAAPGEARAAEECKGIDVCISVPGPWVVIPKAPRGGSQTVYYQLSCPRRGIVGGVDAVTRSRTIDVQFLGAMGSPLRPGVTTSQRVVFVATAASRRITAFRPFIGCIPTVAAGRRTTGLDESSVEPLVPALARPRLLRRVFTLPVRPFVPERLVLSCRRGERLVGSSHAVAFRTRRAPGERVLDGVVAVRRRAINRVDVLARRYVAVPPQVRVHVQVHLLCLRGAA